MSRSVETLRAFMAGTGRAGSYEPRPGVVVVGSGKGGVGTSVVSALMALGAAQRGEGVLLVDADEAVGSLHHMLGVTDPGPGLSGLRGGGASPDELIREVAPGLSLLAGGGGGLDVTLSGATAERRALFRRVSGLYERYDLVVVDGGSRLESVSAACAAGAERLLCVTESGRISLAASYALFKIARARFPDLPVELVLNGVDESTGRRLHAVARRATQSFLGTDVRFGGAIPDDRDLAEALRTGTPMQRLVIDSPAPAAVGALVDRMLLEQDAAATLDAGVLPIHR